MHHRLLVVALVLFSSPSISAQSTANDLRARLISKPLYLRGMWRNDKLSFDDSGKLIGPSKLLSWTLCGVQIKSLKFESGQLVLFGERVGVEIVSNVPKRVVLHADNGEIETIRIAIQTPENGDYTGPLVAIFVESLPDLLPLMPPYWQRFVKNCVLGPSPSAQTSACPQTVKEHTSHAVESVGATAPAVMSAPQPVVSSSARALGYGGRILLSVQVDESGKADHFDILRGIGLGLDEQALVAASQYTFRPAMRDGHAVRSDLFFEVEFQ